MFSRILTLSEFDIMLSEASGTRLPNTFGRLIQASQGPQIQPSHKRQNVTRDTCRRLPLLYNDKYNPWEPPLLD
jgi:hypothetical protein